jgi:hypothetical protein
MNPPAPKTSRLWLWFVAAFAIQAAAWTTWFVIASQHKVQEVPLAGSSQRSAVGSQPSAVSSPPTNRSTPPPAR